LISGLATAVIVVEARERSGSLTTAGHAANQGVDVFAVPGPITAPTSRGTNQLLRDGAFVVLEASDVLSELSISRKTEPARPRPEAPRPGSGPAASGAVILSALEHEPATRDELGLRLGRGPEQLALDLLELELAGRVTLDRDGRWHRRP
jgi:DNA processing protein